MYCCLLITNLEFLFYPSVFCPRAIEAVATAEAVVEAATTSTTKVPLLRLLVVGICYLLELEMGFGASFSEATASALILIFLSFCIINTTYCIESAIISAEPET